MSAYTEYLRGKVDERDGVLNRKAKARFDERGNDVWAYRSGRTYAPEYEGGAMDYSSPEVGNGEPRGGMGQLSRLVGGRTKKHLLPGRSKLPLPEKYPVDWLEGKGSPDYETVDLMERGKAKGGKKPRKPNARASIVKKVMAERGVSMIEASKIVKAEGLY